MNKPAADAFAHWLAENHPDVFVSVAKAAIPSLNQLSDISDMLSSIGSSFSDAASAVGDWVSNPQNIQSLSNVASAYFKTQGAAIQAHAQTAVLNTQLQRAQYGQIPAAISYQINPATGVQMPMYNGQPLSPQQLATLQPSFLQKYGIWLALAGAGVVAVLILRS